ncbi:MAG TPA: hypothetical protein VNE39_04660 [Planctomycetota bacterium]|nr:hypothetical protein [Planctomycetota bacterium]
MRATTARIGRIVSCLLVCAAACVHAAPITNGGFESGDFTGWTTVGVASVLDATFGSGPIEGTYQAFMNTLDGSAPLLANQAAIEVFLGLPAGRLDAINSSDAIEGSAIRQSLTGDAGDILSFDWNFLTNEIEEGEGVNDFAFWCLVNLDTGQLLADIFTPGFVASPTAMFEDETGFRNVTFALPSGGTFVLGFGVVDVGDPDVASGLLIDNVSLTSTNAEIPEPCSITLCVLGALGLVARRARGKRRK